MTNRVHVASAGGLAVVTVAAVGVWSGLSVGDVVRFAAFEAYFTAIPGIAVYTVFFRSHRLLERVAFGWALGYAMALGAFAITRSLGVPPALAWYPVPVLAGAALALRRHPAPIGSGQGVHPAVVWSILGLGAVAFGYFAVNAFVPTPLLGSRVTSVTHYPDLVFGQSLAGEAIHQWPLTMPSVSGVALQYHWFAFWHMGSTADITGLELDRVVLRLFYLPLIPLLILQLVAAGQALFGSIRAGIMAVVATLLAGEWDFDRVANQPFFGGVIDSFYFSPSTLFGAIFFVPLVVILGRLLHSASRRGWVLAGVFMLAAAGAKASVLPVLVGGALGVAGWNAVRRRTIDRRHLAVAAAVLAAFAIGYVALYRGATAGVSIGIGQYLTASPAWELLMRRTGGTSGAIVAGVVGIGALLAPLAGMVIRPRRSDHRTWLWWCVAAGVAATYLVAQPGLSQGYFLIYALIAGGLLSGAGLDRGLDLLQESMTSRRLAITWVMWLGLGTYIILQAHRAISAWGLRLLPRARMEAILAMAIVVVLLFVLLTFDRARKAGKSAPIVAAAVIGIVSLALLDAPLDSEDIISDALEARGAVTVANHRGATTAIVDGLRWVRDHTPEDAVLAVNNHYLGLDDTDARYFYYSAYSERRIVLESWGYSPAGLAAGLDRVAAGYVPYADRHDLIRALYTADSDALATLIADYGLTHVVNDKVNGSVDVDLESFMTVVYSNDAIDVYAVGDLKATAAAADN